jgi:hypothetical protein
MSIHSHTSKQLVELIDQRDIASARPATNVPLSHMDSVSAALIEASLYESGYEVRYPNLRRVAAADFDADTAQPAASTSIDEGRRRRRLVLFGVRRHR